MAEVAAIEDMARAMEADLPDLSVDEWHSPAGVAFAAERVRTGYLLGVVEGLLVALEAAGRAAKSAGHAAELAAWNARMKLMHELGGIGDGTQG